MNAIVARITDELHGLAQPEKIPLYTKFFRAEKGDLCEGDVFLALPIPELRKRVSHYYTQLDLEDCVYFLQSPINEMRFFGQQVLKKKYEKTPFDDTKDDIIAFMMEHISSVNHWNLVDGIASIFADFTARHQSFELLNRLRSHHSVWKKRLSMVACIYLFKARHKTYELYALETAELCMHETHPYIQKSLGWMLRELGKYNESLLISFLQTHWKSLSSVTRSYATEKLRKTYAIDLLLNKT